MMFMVHPWWTGNASQYIKVPLRKVSSFSSQPGPVIVHVHSRVKEIGTSVATFAFINVLLLIMSLIEHQTGLLYFHSNADGFQQRAVNTTEPLLSLCCMYSSILF